MMEELVEKEDSYGKEGAYDGGLELQQKY